ncbi:MAG: DinB family protein [Firmicutes bacterium]|nr:DinB family protein [Bacillota bacterium]
MTPEQAVVLRDCFVEALEEEAKITRRVLEAVPAKGSDYRPDPKSRTGLELAWHIAAADAWFIDGIIAGKFDAEAEAEGNTVPAEIRSGADVVKWYDTHYVARIGELRKLTGDQLAQVTEIFGAFQLPLVQYILFLNNHQIHHRGQLSAYLRAMGSKVPQIYGGSADEPFSTAASG